MSVHNVSTIYTTTTSARVRGFSLTLLEILKKGDHDVSDLREITGKYRQFINRYLYNLRNYGLVQKIGQFWKITSKGDALITHKLHIHNIHNIHMYTKEERRKKEGRKKEESSFQTKPKQVSLLPFLKNSALSEVEKVVVEVLVGHYNQTGSKFIYFKDIYEGAEKLGVNPITLPEALRNLKQENIAYLYHDKTMGCWKLGLYKAFIQTLKQLHV